MSRNETDRPTTERQRIAKLMARVGLCSRREAEAWILAGRVTVNGTVLTSPAVDVAPDDRVTVDGAPLPAAEKTRLFLFHKPRGLVTSDHDPEGRSTVADYLREHWPEGPRIVTIGRLDINTEGLLLLTNDGGLARLLELPQTGWMRRYRVRAKGVADVATLDSLADGVTVDGIDYAGIEAKLDRTQGANCWLTMGLREGKNREIKRVLEHIGLEVNRLIRLSFGPFQLLDLPEGAVEEVRTRVLRDQLGADLAAKAGVTFGETAEQSAAHPREREEAGERRAVRPRENRRDPRGERPVRRSAAPSTDHRDGRGSMRREARDLPEPKRERPAAGTRKHVSTLRADEAETARRGPRKRIERSDAKVRGDRTVTVERLVAARPVVAAATSPRRRAVRDDTAPANRMPRGGKPGDAPREDGAGAVRARQDRGRRDTTHASPSALGKRERIARSGGRPHDERPDRDERDGRARQGRDRRDGAHQEKRRPKREREDRARRDTTPKVHARDSRADAAGRSARTRSSSQEPPRADGNGAPQRRGSARPAARREGTGVGRDSARPRGNDKRHGGSGRPAGKSAGRKPPGGNGGRPRNPSKPKR